MGGTSPGQRKTNCLPAINNHTAVKTCSGYLADCCSASADSQPLRFSASHRNQVLNTNNKEVNRHLELRSSQNAAQLKVTRRSLVCYVEIRGEIRFERGDLELFEGHRVPWPHAGGSPRRGGGPNGNPTPRSLRSVGTLPTTTFSE